ncbi:Na+/H+ antiporter NhaD [Marinactinospora thermotolerans DSM 45154]|uniref:Na+/H+ antiporter NhaD n=1 Tax=Marinactinospora thermotolerans DSM 45154 TaxID=1122192 RepID=A0A1T4KPW6_9ACTN|nr:Na+/H+ antiporter NhaD [Marinactinospora thermotolerans DSM 45154]
MAAVSSSPPSPPLPDPSPTTGEGRPARPSGWRRFGVLDLVRLGLLVLGLLFVLTGVLPTAVAVDSVARVSPLLLFLTAVIVLAELARRDGLFDVIATRVAILGRGNYALLFALCLAFASLTTALFNLDTTAVLLTPVLLALAARAGIAALPLAMTTVWTANTASLLLPVSNLTNLLAMDRAGLSTHEFAARMWAPQLAAIAVTALFLWFGYWRRGARGARRYEVPSPTPVGDRPLLWAAATACLLFAVGVLAGAPVELVATVAAALLVVAHVLRDRAALTSTLIPWRLLVFVTGLFLVVPALNELGLAALLAPFAGEGAGSALRVAAVGAALGNLVNNLPAYTAVEAVLPAGEPGLVLALLIGTNVGVLVTPWASLATLLWLESCRRHGVRIAPVRFALLGGGLAVVATGAAVAALPAGG